MGDMVNTYFHRSIKILHTTYPNHCKFFHLKDIKCKPKELHKIGGAKNSITQCSITMVFTIFIILYIIISELKISG